MRIFAPVLVAFGVGISVASAQIEPLPTEAPEEIVVAEEREGPRFWRVHDGDTEIFVLPSVSYLPADFIWNDRGVARLLERADSVLTTARVEASAGDKARLMGAMLRTMTVNRGRIFMPKDETLETHVGPDLARAFEAAFARAKAREAARKKSGDDASGLADIDEAAVANELEDLDPKRVHPFLQANQLWDAAVDGAGLKTFSVIEKRVARLADRADVPVRAMIEKNLAFSDAKNFLTSMKDFSPETDRACISDAVEFAERRLSRAYLLAEAWARGDVETLARSAEAPRESACMKAVSRELGGLATFGGATLDEISGPNLVAGALEDSLKKPGLRLAVVHADGWLSAGGARDTLRARGVAVDEPSARRPPEAASAGGDTP
jgi:hypothetical protein